MLTFWKMNIFALISILTLTYGQLITNHAGLKELFPDGIGSNDHLTPKMLRGGVSVDHAFEDNSRNTAEFKSSPGCPSQINGYPWLKYGKNPTKCYLAGFQGPCPQNMKIFINPKSEFGYCQCDCFENNPGPPYEEFCHKPQDENYFNRWNPGQFMESYTYYRPTGLCYKLFSEGPCKFGEWLKMDFQKSPPATCASRRCPHPETQFGLTNFFSSNTSSCYTVGEECRVKFSESIGSQKRFRYAFVPGSWVPQCVEYIGGSGGFGPPVVNTNCQQDEIFNKLLNRCMKPFKVSRMIG